MRGLFRFVNDFTPPSGQTAAGTAGGKVGRVAILLALHRSQDYLGELLVSIAGQSHHDWSLHAALDGQDDGSAAMIRAFALAQAQPVCLTQGPGLGFAANFLYLLASVGPEADFVAFCDHDDFWLPDKLARAVHSLDPIAAPEPALYASRSLVCDRRLRPIALSPRPGADPGFRDALSRSIASGNTMVLNRAAINLLQAAMNDGGKPAFHDWWAYQIVAGAGGRIVHDPAPSLLYRQHRQNLLGSALAARGKLRRLRAILSGEHRRWTATQIAALRASRHRLLPEHRQMLDAHRLGRWPFLRRGRLPLLAFATQR